jgi:pimeloyl-ACP methyl ester carboxylesterase
VIESVRATLLRNDPVGYLRSYVLFAQADEELAREAARIPAPVLIIAAEEDVGSTPQMAAALRQVIGDAQLSIVPGVRHMLPLENPQQLADLLQAFFERGDR